MTEPAPSAPRIDDAAFAHAVELIDVGDVTSLQQWLDRHPHLLTATAEEDGSFAGPYFARPRLLWFIAENPIRHGTLPANITAVADTLIEASRRHGVADLNDVLDYTLALVGSGCVARECSLQLPLIETLIAAGADASAAIDTALAHRERAAAEALARHCQDMTLPTAAGLGAIDVLEARFDAADETERLRALTLAAINGQTTATRILVDRGVDPDRYSPPPLGAHATPLHHAVNADSSATVCCLVSRGADVSIEDRIHGATPVQWAHHLERTAIIALFEQAAVMMVAIEAIRAGDRESLSAWLRQHPERVDHRLGDNPRSLLHYATDWPGKWPRAADSIRLLIEAGADPNTRYGGDRPPHTETPLHWAASSDAVEAIDALVAGGADLDPTGGCIENGTPLLLAVIFKKWRAAHRLLESGAAFDLPIAAALGRLDLLATFFDDAGRFHNPHGDMPHRDSSSDPQRELNSGLLMAARGARTGAASYLIERGADVNAVSVIDKTPLEEAVESGADDLVERLRAAGARDRDTG